jgi:hypothetical protein
MNNCTLLFSVCALTAACSGGTEGDSGATADPDLYSLTLDVSIESEEGAATFLTPTVSPQDVDINTIVGKPWYMAFFDAGAEPGVDVPVHANWGDVGEDLFVSYTTPAQFESGPHDAVFVVYIEAEIEEEDKDDEFAPLAVGGDLASFTLGEQVVRDGDPNLHLAFLRFNVDDQDTQVGITNKTPMDWDDDEQLLDAFIDTILIVP